MSQTTLHHPPNKISPREAIFPYTYRSSRDIPFPETIPRLHVQLYLPSPVHGETILQTMKETPSAHKKSS